MVKYFAVRAEFRLVGPRSRSGRTGEEKNVWALSGIDPRFPGPSSRYVLNCSDASLVADTSDVSFVRFDDIRVVSMKADAVLIW